MPQFWLGHVILKLVSEFATIGVFDTLYPQLVTIVSVLAGQLMINPNPEFKLYLTRDCIKFDAANIRTYRPNELKGTV